MSTWSRLIAPLLLLGALPALGADFEQAMSLYKASKFQEAASEFRALVEESPDYSDGHFMLANSLAQAGKLDEAVASFQKAIELVGDKFEYHVNLANTYAKLRKWDKVVSTLETAEPLADDKYKPVLYKLRGEAYAQRGNWERAVADLERVPADARVLETLGKGYLKLGDDKAALQKLSQVYAKDPKNAEARELAVEAQLNLAAHASDADIKKRLYGEALKTAREVAGLKPGTFEASYLVARAALGAGEFDLAVQSFAAALAKKPNHCAAMVNQGKAHMGKEDWVGAYKAFDAATTCDPKMLQAWENKAYTLQKQEKLEEAIKVYERALALSPGSSFAKENLQVCRTNLEVQQHNQAVAEAERQQEEAAAKLQAEYEEELRKREEWERKQKEGGHRPAPAPGGSTR